MRDGKQRGESDGDRRSGEQDGSASAPRGVAGRGVGREPRGEGFPESADDEKSVVDPQAEADHRDEALDEGCNRPPGAHNCREAKCDDDHECARHHWNEGGGDRSEREYQEQQRDREGTPLGGTRVGGAHVTQVRVQGGAPRPPEGEP